MNKMHFSLACLTGVVLGASALVAEHAALLRARGEKAALEQRLAQLNAVSATPTQVIQPTINTSAELERLGAVVASQAAQLKSMQEQISNVTVPPFPTNFPFSIMSVQIPRDVWAFAGYDTPANALASALSAARDGDAAALRNSLTPDALQRRGWNTKPDTDVIAEAADAITNATGVEILKYEMQNDNQRTHLTIYLDGVEQSRQPIWIDFDKIGNDWKCNYN